MQQFNIIVKAVLANVYAVSFEIQLYMMYIPQSQLANNLQKPQQFQVATKTA